MEQDGGFGSCIGHRRSKDTVNATDRNPRQSRSVHPRNGWLPNLFRSIVGKAKEFLQAIIREKDMPPKPVLNMDMDEFRTMQTHAKGTETGENNQKIQEVTLPNLRQQLAETTGIFWARSVRLWKSRYSRPKPNLLKTG